jgi:hypothetical protein
VDHTWIRAAVQVAEQLAAGTPTIVSTIARSGRHRIKTITARSIGGPNVETAPAKQHEERSEDTAKFHRTSTFPPRAIFVIARANGDVREGASSE